MHKFGGVVQPVLVSRSPRTVGFGLDCLIAAYGLALGVFRFGNIEIAVVVAAVRRSVLHVGSRAIVVSTAITRSKYDTLVEARAVGRLDDDALWGWN